MIIATLLHSRAWGKGILMFQHPGYTAMMSNTDISVTRDFYSSMRAHIALQPMYKSRNYVWSVEQKLHVSK